MKWPLLLIVMPMVFSIALASYVYDFEGEDLSDWFFSSSADASLAQLEAGDNLLRVETYVDGDDSISWYMGFYKEGKGVLLSSPVGFKMYHLADKVADDGYITCAVLYGDGSTQSTDAVPRGWKTNEWVEIDCGNDAGKAVKGVELSFWRSATGTFYFDDVGFYEEPGLTGAAVAGVGSVPVIVIGLVVGLFSIYLVRR